MNSEQMTIGQLKELIKELPDDSVIKYSDPNFSGAYEYLPEEYAFSIINNELRISFPFESPVY